MHLPVRKPRLTEAANLVLARHPWLKAAEIELSLTFTDDPGIEKLNLAYRNLAKPTDVLSFPLLSADEMAGLREQTGPVLPLLLLGDIVISEPTMQRQAEQYGHSAERELIFLFVHGLLHLLGYDHELGPAAEQLMFAEQGAILKLMKLE